VCRVEQSQAKHGLAERYLSSGSVGVGEKLSPLEESNLVPSR
jgi:hypothetical protein